MVQKPERHDSREDLLVCMVRPELPKRESSVCVTPASMKSRARMMHVARRWQSASLPKETPTKPKRQKSIDHNDDEIRALFPPIIVTEKKSQVKQKKLKSKRSESSDASNASLSSLPENPCLASELVVKKSPKREGFKESSKSFSVEVDSKGSCSFQLLQSKTMWTSTSSGLSPIKPKRQHSKDSEEFLAQLSPPGNRHARPKSRKYHSCRDLTNHERIPEPFISSPPLQINVPKKSKNRPTIVELASIRSFIQEKRSRPKASPKCTKSGISKMHKPVTTTKEASPTQAKIKSLLHAKKERVDRMRKMLSDIRLGSSKFLNHSRTSTNKNESDKTNDDIHRPEPPQLEHCTWSDCDDSINSNITGSEMSA
jgi:hypothetical protein